MVRPASLVTDATHGHDDLRPLRVLFDLGPQPLDMHVDQPGVGGVPVTPDLLEQHLAGEDLARLAGEGDEKVEFERGEVQRLAVPFTEWPATSMLMSPIWSISGAGSSVRRSRARIRATSSLDLNGLTR